MKNKFIIIVTGKSGSGKSSFSNELSKIIDAELISLDKISHQSLEDESIKKMLINNFGNKIIDNNNHIDRKLLGSIVFNDKNKLKFLNSICENYIEESVDKLIFSTQKQYIILEYSLLPKMKFFEMANYKILIKANKEIRHKRIINRDAISSEYLKIREKHSLMYKTANYDEIIINNTDFLQNLSNFAEKIAKKIQTPINQKI